MQRRRSRSRSPRVAEVCFTAHCKATPATNQKFCAGCYSCKSKLARELAKVAKTDLVLKEDVKELQSLVCDCMKYHQILVRIIGEAQGKKFDPRATVLKILQEFMSGCYIPALGSPTEEWYRKMCT